MSTYEYNFSIGSLINLTNPLLGGIIDSLKEQASAENISPEYTAQAKAIQDLLTQALNDPANSSLAEYVKGTLSNSLNAEDYWTENADGSITVNEAIIIPNEGEEVGLPGTDVDVATSDGTTASTQFPLDLPEVNTNISVPEGYQETIQYWSTAELMTFQFELALKARWQSIGNKLLLDGLGVAQQYGEALSGLMDFASGVLDPFGWGTPITGSGGGIIDPATGQLVSAGGNVFTSGDSVSVGKRNYPEYVISGSVPCCFPLKDWSDPARGLPLAGSGSSAAFGAPRTRHKHGGNDLRGPANQPVLAMWDGWIDEVDTVDNSIRGLAVRVHSTAHPGFTAFACHCNKILVDKNQRVAAGQVIALNGATGNAEANHVHFELRKNGVAFDPAPWLRMIAKATILKKQGQNPVVNLPFF